MCPSESFARREGAAAAEARRGPLRPAFDVLDADRDGKIGRDDLKAFYSGGGGGEDEANIGSMIEAADADRDGYVAFEEFERAVLLRGGGGVMEEVFRVMDRDGDGRVGFADLRGYLDWAALPATDDDVRAMLRMGGGEDEVVSYEGLLKILSVDSISQI